VYVTNTCQQSQASIGIQSPSSLADASISIDRLKTYGNHCHCIAHNQGIGNLIAQITDHVKCTQMGNRASNIVDRTEIRPPDIDTAGLVGDDTVGQIVHDAVKAAFQYIRTGTFEMAAPKAQSTLPTVDAGINGIVPSPNTGAGPATTIILPSTSYIKASPDDQHVHTRKRDESYARKSIVISQKSVAEIIWNRNGSAPMESTQHQESTGLSYRSSSEDQADHRHEKNDSSIKSSAYDDIIETRFYVHHYQNTDVAGLVTGLPVPTLVQDDRIFTTFPRLIPRHCTLEWFQPLSPEGALSSSTTNCMYEQGIDAHSGVDRPLHKGSHTRTRRPEHHHSLFSGNPFLMDERRSINRRLTEISPSLLLRERLISVDGDSSRRYSSQEVVPPSRAEPLANESQPPTLIERSCQSGHKSLRGSHSHTSVDNANDRGTPRNFLADEEHSMSSSRKIRSRDSIVRELSPIPAQLDKSGIYEAMTGSRLVLPRKRKDTCSEDYQPHVCEQDHEY
jgi:hypothetical protein